MPSPPRTALQRPILPSTDLAEPVVRRIGEFARRVAFHVMHPTVREPCVERTGLRALSRLYYQAADGWRSPIYVLPAAPGRSGEPVVLAHALGARPDAFRYGSGSTLAHRLSRAGYTVYLLGHRGDAGAMPSPNAGAFDFDDLLKLDVPAAIARIREHAGFPRVHWIGHGLGGQLGLGAAARGEAVASVVALCAPVTFDRLNLRTEVRRLAQACSLLPAHWQLPSRAVAWASVPWMHETAASADAGQTSGPRLRGVMSHGVEDLPVGLLAQLHKWVRRGAWTDRTGLVDYAEALVDASVDLFVVVAQDDGLCPPDSGLLAQARWGGSATSLVLPEGWGHLDPITATDAGEQVHRPIVEWLEARRRQAWAADPSD